MLAQYEQKLEALRERQKRLEARKRSLSATTTDGVKIAIKGNIEFPFEAATCYDYGACGVGLYRTEFLYLTSLSGSLPTEDTHFEAYKQVAESMNGRQVTIRTFDLGADKLPAGLKLTPEEGLAFLAPASSLPSQWGYVPHAAAAILRADNYGKIVGMFPLVTRVVEFAKPE